MGRGGWQYGEGEDPYGAGDAWGPSTHGHVFDWSQSDPADRDWTPRPDPYDRSGGADRGARPRDPSDPRRYPFAPRTAVPRRTAWQLDDGLPTLPTVLVGLGVVVLAFVIGHATAGGGGSTAVATRPADTIATTTTLGPFSTHTVGRGETLSSIATGYGVAPRDLASLNNISDYNQVFVGEVLKIPPPPPPPPPPTTTTTTTPTPTTTASATKTKH